MLLGVVGPSGGRSCGDPYLFVCNVAVRYWMVESLDVVVRMNFSFLFFVFCFLKFIEFVPSDGIYVVGRESRYHQLWGGLKSNGLSCTRSVFLAFQLNKLRRPINFGFCGLSECPVSTHHLQLSFPLGAKWWQNIYIFKFYISFINLRN